MLYRTLCHLVMAQQRATATTTNYFLTEKSDPYGRTLYFHYITNASGALLLDSVVDWDNKTNYLAYTNTSYPRYITSVSDATGRSAQLKYDASGNLTQIVDMQGITNQFKYDNTGFMTNMITPYGTTAFANAEIGNDSNNPSRRSMLVTLPDGNKEFFQFLAYCDSDTCSTNVPSYYSDAPVYWTEMPEPIADNDGCYMHRRNSFHWNSQQLPADPSNPQPADYRKARMRHWLLNGNELSILLGMERSPSPDGTTLGHKVWYAYTYDSGDTRLWPTMVAERLPDSTVRYTQWTRNDWGLPTAIASTYQDGATVGCRYSGFQYDDDNTSRLLLQASGPEQDQWGSLIVTRQYGYSTNNQVIAFTNALNEVTTYSYSTNRNLTGIAYPQGLQLAATLSTSGFVTDLAWKDTNNPTLATYAFTWSNGKIASVTDPRGLTVNNTWDNLGRLTQRSYPDGSSIQNVYYKPDGSGYTGGTGGTNLLDRTRFKDRLGNWTSFRHNSLRQVTAVTNALGKVTQYDWCACGLLDSVTDPMTNTTSYQHDLAGQLTAIHYPETNRVVHVDWDDAGRPTNIWDTLGAGDPELQSSGPLDRRQQQPRSAATGGFRRERPAHEHRACRRRPLCQPVRRARPVGGSDGGQQQRRRALRL
jgi:YD repeat-containing protein